MPEQHARGAQHRHLPGFCCGKNPVLLAAVLKRSLSRSPCVRPARAPAPSGAGGAPGAGAAPAGRASPALPPALGGGSPLPPLPCPARRRPPAPRRFQEAAPPGRPRRAVWGRRRARGRRGAARGGGWHSARRGRALGCRPPRAALRFSLLPRGARGVPPSPSQPGGAQGGSAALCDPGGERSCTGINNPPQPLKGRSVALELEKGRQGLVLQYLLM